MGTEMDFMGKTLPKTGEAFKNEFAGFAFIPFQPEVASVACWIRPSRLSCSMCGAERRTSATSPLQRETPSVRIPPPDTGPVLDQFWYNRECAGADHAVPSGKTDQFRTVSAPFPHRFGNIGRCVSASTGWALSVADWERQAQKPEPPPGTGAETAPFWFPYATALGARRAEGNARWDTEARDHGTTADLRVPWARGGSGPPSPAFRSRPNALSFAMAPPSQNRPTKAIRILYFFTLLQHSQLRVGRRIRRESAFVHEAGWLALSAVIEAKKNMHHPP